MAKISFGIFLCFLIQTFVFVISILSSALAKALNFVPALDTLPDALEYSNIDLSGIKVPVYTQPDAPAPIE